MVKKRQPQKIRVKSGTMRPFWVLDKKKMEFWAKLAKRSQQYTDFQMSINGAEEKPRVFITKTVW